MNPGSREFFNFKEEKEMKQGMRSGFGKVVAFSLLGEQGTLFIIVNSILKKNSQSKANGMGSL